MVKFTALIATGSFLALKVMALVEVEVLVWLRASMMGNKRVLSVLMLSMLILSESWKLSLTKDKKRSAGLGWRNSWVRNSKSPHFKKR